VNDNIAQIQILLGKVEALLRRYPHLITWVEQMVKNVEQQKWS
jgi:hypothetical protein